MRHDHHAGGQKDAGSYTGGDRDLYAGRRLRRAQDLWTAGSLAGYTAV